MIFLLLLFSDCSLHFFLFQSFLHIVYLIVIQISIFVFEYLYFYLKEIFLLFKI